MKLPDLLKLATDFSAEIDRLWTIFLMVNLAIVGWSIVQAKSISVVPMIFGMVAYCGVMVVLYLAMHPKYLLYRSLQIEIHKQVLQEDFQSVELKDLLSNYGAFFQEGKRLLLFFVGIATVTVLLLFVIKLGL
ncbi:MAG: hypothetical protein HZA88_11750 [Verrucomicrobia bacterium]|nr:hypothetical protein [Verrucomicrobiota bacterium]